MECILLFLRPLLFLGIMISEGRDEFPCGDLLEKYASKPTNLEFVKCEQGEGQTVVLAEYRVSGMESKGVEDFLVQEYGMGQLKWVCCGWENQGKYGNFTHEAILSSNENYGVIISMFGSGEMEDGGGKTYLEFDRNKVPYFYVWVSIVEV